MKRKKLTIDLGNMPLTDVQLKKLLAEIHTTVEGNLKKIKKPLKITASKPPEKPPVGLEAAPLTSVTATISATFTNTNPGLSEVNATFNGVTKKITQTDTIVFDKVSSGDVIMIQGKSLGTSDISIDIEASPRQMKFVPGTFNFNFFIL
jgi:hypothetical protein